MITVVNHFLYRAWSSIVDFGVHPGMTFVEVRRTRLINLLTLPCIPMMAFFCVLNAIQGRAILSTLNFITTATCIVVLFLHRYRKYLSARLVLLSVGIVIYTFTGMYFQNGSEYFLLNILLVTILVYDRPWVLATFLTLSLTGMLMILLFPQESSLMEPVPRQRVGVNIATALGYSVVALVFFKKMQYDYQQEVERQRQELAAMNKDQEKLFSIVAHDVRSPLATLEVLLDMFRKGEYPEDQMLEATDVLHNRVAQLGTTLDNILRWSTRSMKGIRTQPEDFPLGALIEETSGFFQLVIQQKQLQLRTDIPLDMILYADRDQVAVVLRNLLSNALKFSFPGGVVTVAAQRREGNVDVSIVDNGAGMSVEQRERLFSGGQQPGYGTEGERGAGIGLLLSQEFAVLNNGTISVESHPGEGACFTLTLPEGNPDEVLE
ncbi:sensor histidine kinase [Chitinophaga lutea]